MSRKNHKNVGVNNGLLNPCPDLYNCVCSQYTSHKRHYLTPWKYKGSPDETIPIISKVLTEESQIEIIKRTDNYIHAEVTVPVFGFIDDLEFLISEEKRVLHFRSASRLGTWDFGLNKFRLQKLKKKLRAAGLELE